MLSLVKNNPSLTINDTIKCIDFSHYHWSPPLYLSQLHQLRLNLHKKQFKRASELVLQLFRLIEEEIFERNDSQNSSLLESTSAFLSHLLSLLKRQSGDLTPDQQANLITRLKHLEVNIVTFDSIKEMAISNLSSLMGKCQGVVDVMNEAQMLAFIIDRFLRPNSLPEQNLDYSFDGQTFFVHQHLYATPLSTIEKILILESDKFHRPLGKECFYLFLDTLIPVRDVEARPMAEAKQKCGLVLNVDSKRWLLPIDELSDIVRNLSAHKKRRTVMNGEQLLFKIRTT